jgi:hypothetical protein
VYVYPLHYTHSIARCCSPHTHSQEESPQPRDREPPALSFKDKPIVSTPRSHIYFSENVLAISEPAGDTFTGVSVCKAVQCRHENPCSATGYKSAPQRHMPLHRRCRPGSAELLHAKCVGLASSVPVQPGVGKQRRFLQRSLSNFSPSHLRTENSSNRHDQPRHHHHGFLRRSSGHQGAASDHLLLDRQGP